MEKKFGKLSIIKYVALPDSLTHVRNEKKVTLASIHCYLNECAWFVEQFKEANPDIKGAIGHWTRTESVTID
jgi:hypothetical protein